MKVYELLERAGNIKHVSVSQLPDMEGNKPIGSGYEAKVYNSKDVGTVIKEVTIRGNVEESAIYNYINMVMSHQDNPFFPRINNAKLYTHKTMGAHKLVIQMEKLTDFNNAKVEHLLPQLLDQLGIDIQDVAGRSKYRINQISSGNYGQEPTSGNDEREEYRRGQERKETLGDLGDVLWQRFRTKQGREELMKVAKNPQVKEAIKLTDEVLNAADARHAAGGSRETSADLHDSNIMVRLTSHGPQLVITDPMADFERF